MGIITVIVTDLSSIFLRAAPPSLPGDPQIQCSIDGPQDVLASCFLPLTHVPSRVCFLLLAVSTQISKGTLWLELSCG